MEARRTERRRFPTVGVFCTCWLIFAVHWAPFMIREQFPAITLATSGTLNVERFLGWSPDVFAGPGGRAFINNNPGASIVAALPLFLARPMLNALERWNDRLPSSIDRGRNRQFAASTAVQGRREWYFMAVAFLTSAWLMAPISALVVTALGWTLWAGGLPRFQAVAAASLFGFATPVFVRTGYLNHNLLVGHAGALAALLLWDPARGTLTRRRAAAAGAFGGFAVLCDYSGLLVLGAAALYTWLRAGDREPTYRERLRSIAFYGAGAAPLLVILAGYQWWAFGSAALPSQHVMPAIEETARGYRGMGWPSLELAWMNFFDLRFGLFVVCPLLSLSVAAPFVRHGRFRLPPRETWLILGFFGAFTAFCASNQYSRLQWTTGIRYLVPTVPGLLLLSLQVLQILPTTIRVIALTVSMLLGWLPAVMHAPVMSLARNPDQFQLSWIRRMAEYGAVRQPVAMTIAILVSTGGALALIWAPQIARAISRHAGPRRKLQQTAGTRGD